MSEQPDSVDKEAEQAKPHQAAWHRVAHRAWLGAILVVAVAVALAYRWASQPAVGVPTVDSASKKIATAPVGNRDLDTALFTTRIPAVFTIRQQQDTADKTVLARLVATEVSDGSGELGFTIRQLPADGLGGASEVHYRTLNPEKYTAVSLAGLPAGALAFRSAIPYELSVFIPQGSRYASIVLSNTKNAAAYDDWMLTVLSNWRWK